MKRTICGISASRRQPTIQISAELTFLRYFGRKRGKAFSGCLTRYRIEKAKLMLKNHALKVYEVGRACGFEDYRYFTKVFKEYTGVSPGEYK